MSFNADYRIECPAAFRDQVDLWAHRQRTTQQHCSVARKLIFEWLWTEGQAWAYERMPVSNLQIDLDNLNMVVGSFIVSKGVTQRQHRPAFLVKLGCMCHMCKQRSMSCFKMRVDKMTSCKEYLQINVICLGWDIFVFGSLYVKESMHSPMDTNKNWLVVVLNFGGDSDEEWRENVSEIIDMFRVISHSFVQISDCDLLISSSSMYLNIASSNTFCSPTLMLSQ